MSDAMSGRTFPSCVTLTSETAVHACNLQYMWWN